jgi:hypothetical protein
MVRNGIKMGICPEEKLQRAHIAHGMGEHCAMEKPNVVGK